MQKQMAKQINEQAKNKINVPTLRIVDVQDVKTGKGTRGINGPKYVKYDIAIEPHVLWLQQTIAGSKDGIIRIRNKDIAQTMGGEFIKKNPTSIYWGLKYVLFFKDIVVDTGTNTKNEKLLVMRAKQQGDKLPPSLDKLTAKPDKKPEAKAEVVVPQPIVRQDISVKAIKPKRLITAMRLPKVEEGELATVQA